MSGPRTRAGVGLRPSRRRRAWPLVLLFLGGTPVPAVGHGQPVALAIWGDFPPAVARCQRDIGRAAALCGLQAWRLRRNCALGDLRGVPCDAEAATASIEAARLAAAHRVSASCTTSHIAMLQFAERHSHLPIDDK